MLKDLGCGGLVKVPSVDNDFKAVFESIASERFSSFTV